MLRFCVLAVLTLSGCEAGSGGAATQSEVRESRALLHHRGSINDARALESVTGPMHFAQGCWTVSSGPNRIALYFPREATLLESGEIGIGQRRFREGEVYKFVGDLAETGVDLPSACNGLGASMAVGDVWPAEAGRQTGG
jgi:hypothetical protein